MTDVIVNWGGVIGATVAAMVIGSLWYSPLLFMKPWMAALGMTKESMQAKGGSATKSMIGMLILAFVQAYVMAHFVSYVAVATVGEGATLGFWLWIGFVLPVVCAYSLFEMRPWKLTYITLGNQLVTLLAMGMILAHWQ